MKTLSIRTSINAGRTREAEQQLALLSSSQGDDQLSLLVAELTDGEVGVLLGEGDFTKPSVVTPFISPQQLLGSLERVGAKWGDLEGISLDGILKLKNEVSDFLLPVLLMAEPASRADLIRKLMSSRLAENVLVALPLYEQGFPESLIDFESGQAQAGTWQDLYRQIKELDGKLFDDLREDILDLYEKDEEGELNTENTAGLDRFLQRTFQGLARKAASLVETQPSSGATERVFEGL